MNLQTALAYFMAEFRVSCGPSYSNCILSSRETTSQVVNVAWVTAYGRLSTAGVSSDRRVMTSLYLHVMRTVLPGYGSVETYEESIKQRHQADNGTMGLSPFRRK